MKRKCKTELCFLQNMFALVVYIHLSGLTLTQPGGCSGQGSAQAHLSYAAPDSAHKQCVLPAVDHDIKMTSNAND